MSIVVIFEIAVIFMSFLAYSYPAFCVGLMIFADFGLFCFVYKTINGSFPFLGLIFSK